MYAPRKFKNSLFAIGLSVAASTCASAVLACDLALALAVDVSGSVDPKDYRIQMQGLADGLRDGIVSEALVKSNAAVMLVQWTGSSRQVVNIPWVKIRSFEDVEDLASRIETTERTWRSFSTAIGEALGFTATAFDQVPDCKRRVIDVSGDGISNEGIEPREVSAALRAKNITVNALVIEEFDQALTPYFWENVIGGEGAFVVTANGFEEYPAKMRQKLLREVSKQIAAVAPRSFRQRASKSSTVRVLKP